MMGLFCHIFLETFKMIQSPSILIYIFCFRGEHTQGQAFALLGKCHYRKIVCCQPVFLNAILKQ